MFPSPNFLIMSVPTQIAQFQKSITYRIPSPSSGVGKKTHIWAINLRFAKVTQHDSFVLFANLAAFFCTQFKARTLPSLRGSKRTALYLVSVTIVLHKLNVSYCYFPLFMLSYYYISACGIANISKEHMWKI